MKDEKDPIVENIENGKAGIVYYHDIDMQIDLLKNQIEKLEESKKQGATKVFIAAWNTEDGKAYLAWNIPTPEGEQFYQDLYDRIFPK